MLTSYLFRVLLFAQLMACQTSASSEKVTTEAVSEIEHSKLPVPKSAKVETIPDYLEYAWLLDASSVERRVSHISLPEGYQRVSVTKHSFAEWLRYLPLHAKNTPVMYYDGSKKPQQNLHTDVVNIDVGKNDLQQCADATMRLRAEYLYATKQYDKIHFNFTNGDEARYDKWRSGYAIKLQNNHLHWYRSTKANASYSSFKKYMKWIFMYAGTASLSKEATKVPDFKNIQAGDILIQGGFPGHAVIVLDIAEHAASGDKLFMVGQSYMPAQSIHVLKNLNDGRLGAWYNVSDCQSTNLVNTPQWRFLYFRSEKISSKVSVKYSN